MKPPQKQDKELFVCGPVGPRGQRVQACRAFGTSMLPLFRSGEELWVEPVDPPTVRIGEIVNAVVRLGGGQVTDPDPERVVTHRIIRRLHINGQLAFLTKGDNRPMFDPMILPGQITGRVTQAGSKVLTRPHWRWLGVVIAWFSYHKALMHYAFCHITYCRPNQIRHHWTVKGWIPKVSIRGALRRFRFFLRSGGTGRRNRLPNHRKENLRGGGIPMRVRLCSPNDLQSLVRVWNEAFPDYPTDADRLQARLLASLWFDPFGSFVVCRNGEILGWAATSMRLERPRFSGAGKLEFVALTKKGCQIGAAELLLERVLLMFERRRVSSIILGPMPNGSQRAEPAERLAASTRRANFTVRKAWVEMVCSGQQRRPDRDEYLSPGLVVRPWRPSDWNGFAASFEDDPADLGRIRRHLLFRGRAEQLLVARRNRKPAGLCQWLPDTGVVDYSQAGNPWVVAQPGSERAYMFHIDAKGVFRDEDAARALAHQACSNAFALGCKEAVCWTPTPALFEPIGFTQRNTFVEMERLAQTL